MDDLGAWRGARVRRLWPEAVVVMVSFVLMSAVAAGVYLWLAGTLAGARP